MTIAFVPLDVPANEQERNATKFVSAFLGTCLERGFLTPAQVQEACGEVLDMYPDEQLAGDFGFNLAYNVCSNVYGDEFATHPTYEETYERNE